MFNLWVFLAVFTGFVLGIGFAVAMLLSFCKRYDLVVSSRELLEMVVGEKLNEVIRHSLRG